MPKYKMYSFKLELTGEFENDKEAIIELADRYMKCSKTDIPGNSVLEKLDTRYKARTFNSTRKVVALDIEIEVFGIKQFVRKAVLNIKPYKREHWWESKNNDFAFDEVPFEYEIVEGVIN